MTDQARKSGSGYIGYEYREITASKEYISICMDSYPCFGWEPDPNRGMAEEGISSAARVKKIDHADKKRLYFRRNRNISNKAELTRLQRNFDSCIHEIEELNRSKTTTALMAALFVGILGTAFMTGSVFAVVAEPPIIWLTILLAVPGFAGWILPYFLYRMLVRKKEAEINPLIEQKYDEIYMICEKGNHLFF